MRHRFGPEGGGNIFRDAWQYRITDAGAERLAARSGASPAFLAVLAIVMGGPASFASIARQMPNIDGDDLELWLSAMCAMDLLSPLEAAPTFAEDAASDPAEPQVPALPAAQVPVVAGVTPAPEALALASAGYALLVHADGNTRAHWRHALSGHGFDFLEAGDLETVEAHMRAHRPAWVVLGLKGEDFEGLHLLRALKRPRAPRISRVCMVVPDDIALDEDEQETVARADATAASVPDIVRALGCEAAHDEHREAWGRTWPMTAPVSPGDAEADQARDDHALSRAG